MEIVLAYETITGSCCCCGSNHDFVASQNMVCLSVEGGMNFGTTGQSSRKISLLLRALSRTVAERLQ